MGSKPRGACPHASTASAFAGACMAPQHYMRQQGWYPSAYRPVSNQVFGGYDAPENIQSRLHARASARGV
jgi:hypothetical protein